MQKLSQLNNKKMKEKMNKNLAIRHLSIFPANERLQYV